MVRPLVKSINTEIPDLRSELITDVSQNGLIDLIIEALTSSFFSGTGFLLAWSQYFSYISGIEGFQTLNRVWKQIIDV